MECRLLFKSSTVNHRWKKLASVIPMMLLHAINNLLMAVERSLYWKKKSTHRQKYDGKNCSRVQRVKTAKSTQTEPLTPKTATLHGAAALPLSQPDPGPPRPALHIPIPCTYITSPSAPRGGSHTYVPAGRDGRVSKKTARVRKHKKPPGKVAENEEHKRKCRLAKKHAKKKNK